MNGQAQSTLRQARRGCRVLFSAAALAVAIGLALPGDARADEGGVSFWLPGIFGSLAAVPLQPLRCLQLLHPEPLRADQAVRVRGEAGQFLAHRVEPFAVIEVDDRAVGQGVLGDFGIMRQALGRRLDRARRIQLAVDLGVAVMRRIQCGRCLAANNRRCTG